MLPIIALGAAVQLKAVWSANSLHKIYIIDLNAISRGDAEAAALDVVGTQITQHIINIYFYYFIYHRYPLLTSLVNFANVA